eukprot:318574_1
MQHLGKEFSFKNMLCFIELVQYKFALKLRSDRIDVMIIEKQETFDKNGMLSGVIEMSSINRNGFNELSLYLRDDDSRNLLIRQAKSICIQLYNKYFKVGTELEINLEYNNGTYFKRAIEDETVFMESELGINELFTLFDDVAAEVLKLLLSSFFRFQNKDEYRVACKILDENNKM